MAATAGSSVRLISTCLPLFVRNSGSPRRVWPWAFACVVGLVLSGGWANRRKTEENGEPASAFWGVGKPVAVAVHEGRARFRAPASKPGSEVMVIVSSLSREKGPFSVELKARAATRAEVPALAVDGPLADPKSRAEHAQPHQDLKRAQVIPARQRVFHMLVRDGDVYSPSNYTAIPAEMRGVGQHSQVYVARAGPGFCQGRHGRGHHPHLR